MDQRTVTMASGEILILSDQDYAYLKGVSWHRGKNGLAKAYMAGKNVYAHRLVAELMLGRSLEKGEIVGFVNGDYLDCRRDNLLIADRADVLRFVWQDDDIRVKGEG